MSRLLNQVSTRLAGLRGQIAVSSSSSSSSSSSPTSLATRALTQRQQQQQQQRTASSTAAAASTTPEALAENCRKVVCIGRNYAAHIAELSSARPSQPFWFFKPTTAIVPPAASEQEPRPRVIVPRGVEAAHEIELALVIGPLGPPGEGKPRARYHNLAFTSLDEVLATPIIAGYVTGIDVTARNAQWEAKRKGLPWSISKGFDTFLPISHFISRERLPNPHDVTVWLTVNGQPRQRDSTSLFLFDVPRVLNDISKVVTLEQGDIILTGTPKGVGPLVHGDVVKGGIEVAGEDLPEARIDVVVEDAKDENGFVYRET